MGLDKDQKTSKISLTDCWAGTPGFKFISEGHSFGIGDKGPLIRDLQKRLNACGYADPALKDDGRFGAQTEIAVKKLQAEFSLTEDGHIGPATLLALKAKESSVGLDHLNADNRKELVEVAGDNGTSRMMPREAVVNQDSLAVMNILQAMKGEHPTYKVLSSAFNDQSKFQDKILQLGSELETSSRTFFQDDSHMTQVLGGISRTISNSFKL